MSDQTTLSDARTTVAEIEASSYWATCKTRPTTHLFKAHVAAVKVVAALTPAPPVPVAGFQFLRDPLEPYASGGGKQPVLLSSGVRCELAGPGISRVHWPVTKRLGEPFSIAATITYTPGFRGTIMRLEDYWPESSGDAPFSPGMHRLELDRWGDGLWRVVRNRHKSLVGGEYTDILGPFTIPSGARIELTGVLDPGVARTRLLVDGVEFGHTTAPNWSSPDSPVASRARFGIVEGSDSQACVVTVAGMSFT